MSAPPLPLMPLDPAHPRRGLTAGVIGAALLLLAAAGPSGCGDDGEDDGNGTGNGTGNGGQGGAFPPPSADFVFAVIGDFGDTLDTRDESTDVQEVERLIESWSPRFIATVGDNDYTDAAYEGTFTGLELGVGQYFHEFIGDYKGDRGPGAAQNRFFPIPGDHDYGDDCDNPRLGDYLEYFTLPQGPEDETYYSVREGPIELFLLDSIVDCHQDGGAKLARQRQWLETRARASDAQHMIVLVHNPPFSSGTRHGSAEHVQWPFAEWGVDVVIAGDDHIYERIEVGGVTYLVNGLGGVEAHPVGPPVAGSARRFSSAFGALGFAVFDTHVEAAFVDVSGNVIDRFTLGEPPATGLDPDAPPVTEGDWVRLAPSTTWQWQLQGTLNTSHDVDVYDIDLFETPASTIQSLQAAGRTVICYFSAGSYEGWRDDADQFAPADLGATLDGFDDERWLDVRSENVARIMQGRLDVAASKGCDGVEPDNVDGFVNGTGFPLTASDQRAFNRFIGNEAHRRGLAVGLKNDLDQVPELVEYFDFIVNEQCHEYDECDALAPFVDAGKAAFVAEYRSDFVNDTAARDAMCGASRAANLRALVLPLDLDDSFRFSCD